MSTYPLRRQGRLFPRLQEERLLILLQEIIKTDAVERLLDFCPDPGPYHFRHAIVGLATITRLAWLQAVGQRDRPLENAHDVADRQFLRLPRKQISAAGSAHALDESRL